MKMSFERHVSTASVVGFDLGIFIEDLIVAIQRHFDGRR